MPRPTPTLADTLSSALDARLAGVRNAQPGIVVSYNPGTQRADVQPAIRDGYFDETGERQSEDLPVVTEVPVVFPGAGGTSLTWPIAAGDEVLLVWSSSSIDRWLGRGGVVDPEDDRRHNLSDAIAIPGLRHAALPGAALGAGLVARAASIQLGSSAATEAVPLGTSLANALGVLADALSAGLGTLTPAAIDSTVRGTMVAAINAFKVAALAALSAKVRVE